MVQLDHGLIQSRVAAADANGGSEIWSQEGAKGDIANWPIKKLHTAAGVHQLASCMVVRSVASVVRQPLVARAAGTHAKCTARRLI